MNIHKNNRNVSLPIKKMTIYNTNLKSGKSNHCSSSVMAFTIDNSSLEYYSSLFLSDFLKEVNPTGRFLKEDYWSSSSFDIRGIIVAAKLNKDSHLGLYIYKSSIHSVKNKLTSP
jgi:hypothetical protein